MNKKLTIRAKDEKVPLPPALRGSKTPVLFETCTWSFMVTNRIHVSDSNIETRYHWRSLRKEAFTVLWQLLRRSKRSTQRHVVRRFYTEGMRDSGTSVTGKKTSRKFRIFHETDMRQISRQCDLSRKIK